MQFLGAVLAGPVLAQERLDLRDPLAVDPVDTTAVEGSSLDLVDETEGNDWTVPEEPRWGAEEATTLDLAELGLTEMRALDSDAARDAGVNGVVFEMGLPAVADAARASNGTEEPASVELELDYSRYADLFGADWAQRLTARPLASDEVELHSVVNDHATETLRVELTLSSAEDAPTELLLAAEPAGAGAGGDFTATDLSPTGEWTHGGSSGGFAWSYPIEVPGTPGGLVPDLALSYSSQDVDGRTAATNNQANWVGDGWTLSPGFIERRYIACEEDKGSGAVNPAHPVGDLCWKRHNATLVLNGSASELVRDDASGAWRKKNDDGTRIELLTGAENGDDNGEHWRVTDPDGVRYHFGLHRLPGWSEGDRTTDSTWTVPVFGNHPDEPCHAGQFSEAWCQQGWRWNLDYVVDPHGNAMSYNWARETNRYARAINASFEGTPTSYVRGGYLRSVEYGLRSDAPLAGQPAGRVAFGVTERCLPADGVDCDWSAVDEDSASHWPDVPFDQHCASGADCEGNASPSFWTTKRLTAITTYARVGDQEQKVDSWALDQSFPSTGDGSAPALWLKSLTRTGHTGEDITLPPVTFRGIQLPNRVEGALDPIPPLNRYRVYAIDTEPGGTIGVTYTDADCAAGDLPNPESNTRRCYPVIWSPPDAPAPDFEPYQDWFHSYAVAQVLESDNTSGAPVARTDYRYPGGMAWSRSQDDFVASEHRAFGERRGYARVQTLTGDPAEGPQTLTETRYFRGVTGQSVEDSEGHGIADHPAYAGLVRETLTYLGDGGPLLDAVAHTPWRSAATATQARSGTPDLNSYHVDIATESARERLSDDSWRRTRMTTSFDAFGMVKQVNDEGDLAVTGDERCTTIAYARNEDLNLLSPESETRTVASACGDTPDLPNDLVTAVRNYHDGATTLGAAPTRGLVTRTDGLNHDGEGFHTVGTSRYDAHGRLTASTDADGNESTVAYTPTTGRAPTSTVETNALGHATETHFDARRGLVTAIKDPNGIRTDVTYDALGRTTAVWQPGWTKSANPNKPSAKYSYRVSTSDPNVVTTEALNHQGNYHTSHAFYDGLLRPRQTQTPAIQVTDGRLVTTAHYDTAGRAWLNHSPYHTAGAPDRTLVTAGDNEIPAATRVEFDAAGRQVAEIAFRYGDETTRTTTVHNGAESTTVIPPTGGTASTSITDVLGRTVEQRSYTNADRTEFQSATYHYDVAGNLIGMSDAAGNDWSWEYDKRGNQTLADDPDKGRTTVSYDALDRPVSTTDARGITLTSGYDALGRPTTLSEGDELRAEWTYDSVKLGAPATSTRYVADAAYTTSVNGYTDRYQPTGTTVTLPESEGALAGDYSWRYTYNARVGLRESVVHPALGGLPQERVTTVYSSQNLPVRTTAGQQILVGDVRFDALGRPIRAEYGHLGQKVYQTFDWDEHNGRLTRATVDGDIALRVQDTRYGYDDNGNVTRVATTANQGEQASSETQCFTTDVLRRLTEAWTTASGDDDCAAGASPASVGGPDPYWHSYTYDLTGNRVNETQHTTTASGTDIVRDYTVGEAGESAPNSLRSVSTDGGPQDGTTETFEHDQAGNLVERAGVRDQTLAWNPEGNLETVTENGTSTDYVYTAEGDRLLTHHADGSATAYLPEGTELNLSPGGTKTALRYFTHGSDTVAVRDSGNNNAINYLIPDPQGTAMLAVTWGAAQLVQRRKQLPFGGQRGETSAAWPGDQGFLGGTTDPTGTTHLGAREYEPQLGRFISVDALLLTADPRQHNPYQYGNNNPLTFSDPTGEAFEECRSGQYKCNYNRKGKLTGVEYGNNYEKITRSVGGTPAPRYIQQKQRLQYACAKDPGCTGTAQQQTARAEQARAAQRAAERAAAEAQREQQSKRADFMTSLLAGDWLGVADATVRGGMDWFNESVKDPVIGWIERHEGPLRWLGHEAVSIGVGFVAGGAAVAVCGATAGLACVLAVGGAAGLVVGTGAHTGLAAATGEEVTAENVVEWGRTSLHDGMFQGWFLDKFEMRPGKYAWTQFQNWRSR
ncbi:RHS repeat-associated core domain-containing protein [Streptomyces sp. DSM 44915]|uniref:RHS repeat-associated core domain-containing protein n=1 Tax=Streptomyces chisholmiae TaxID=3075540 RepID=A0ABU2JWQ3_9ACTN|nr:RHS repeat-associated core domain-containing protein [Streptomyces sp. DSM 44915]MDT0269169.1 RHS repeat-associated core domain-containing protein [Streptomyces sp. DSM 44915]